MVSCPLTISIDIDIIAERCKELNNTFTPYTQTNIPTNTVSDSVRPSKRSAQPGLSNQSKRPHRGGGDMQNVQVDILSVRKLTTICDKILLIELPTEHLQEGRSLPSNQQSRHADNPSQPPTANSVCLGSASDTPTESTQQSQISLPSERGSDTAGSSVPLIDGLDSGPTRRQQDSSGTGKSPT